MATIFDPLGFVAPIVLRAKLMLQAIWKEECGWDEEVTTEINSAWNDWMNDSLCLQDLRIRAFADASTIGYGAVIYLRTVYNDKTVSCEFVIAKSRVAPVRQLTIPRLELQGALVAVRIVKAVQESLKTPINYVHYWTDSATVLQWINSKTCRFQAFVSNRINEILEFSQRHQWHHVISLENPADEVSRGLRASELHQNHRWWNGPALLWNIDVNYPDPVRVREPNATDPEITSRKWLGQISKKAENRLQEWMERSSNIFRVRRVMAYILRFISNNKKMASGETLRKDELSLDELQSATQTCIRVSQSCAFGEEIRMMKAEQSLPKGSSLATLSPFIDRFSIIRVGGRIGRSTVSYNVKTQYYCQQTKELPD